MKDGETRSPGAGAGARSGDASQSGAARPETDGRTSDGFQPIEPVQGPDWWRGAVIYEIYLRSFRDASGDGIGDLRGALEKIDHLVALGVDAVWLSPFFKSPQKDFGYDVSDFRIVDPIAGSMEDFLALRDAVQGAGMRLLLDFVPAHTSDEHPWFEESRANPSGPKGDWYVWADKAADGGPPSNWLSSFGGSAWNWDPRRGQYYFHPFLDCQPALNLQNDAVLDHLAAEMRWWLEHGVDGFRLDAVQCLGYDPALRDNPPRAPHEAPVLVGGGPGNPFRDQIHVFDRNAEGTRRALERFRALADEFDAVLIGELADVHTDEVAEDFTLKGARLHAVYDFDLINSEPEVETVTAQLEQRAERLPTGWRMNVFTNHDSRRSVSNLTGFVPEELRPQAAKMLLFLQLGLRGGAAIFQGEELGLPHPQLTYEQLQDPWAKAFWPDFEGRDGARTLFPWTDQPPHGGFTEAEEAWIHLPEAHLPLNAQAQARDPDSVLSFAREFIRWRRRHEILRLGEERMVRHDPAPLIKWRRLWRGEEWLLAVNFSDDAAFLPIEEGWRLVPAPGCAQTPTAHGLAMPPLAFAILAAES